MIKYFALVVLIFLAFPAIAEEPEPQVPQFAPKTWAFPPADSESQRGNAGIFCP